MDVLILGYGKIGQIKGRIWQSLGRKVHVYDPDERKAAQIEADGNVAYQPGQRLGDDLVIDISTPSGAHTSSLAWILAKPELRPRTIFAEKPLVSSLDELAKLEELLATPAAKGIREKIIVNESYYLSSALEYLIGEIRRLSATVTGVRVDLSKNRLADVSKGRFVDAHLGPMGIETPHMLAMLQALGFDFGDLSITKSVIFQDPMDVHNAGFRVDLAKNDIPVVIESYLGDFRVLDSGKLAPNDGIVRVLEVTTDKATLRIEFDPVPGLPRYISRVGTKEIEDNHLGKHWAEIHRGYPKELKRYTGVDNALATSQFLLRLRAEAEVVSVPSTGAI
jgi:predicted dehydrogenase